MKIIVQDKPDFIVNLGEANTGDYALEDFLIIYDNSCNSITFPPQDTIKGNPTFYLQCVSDAEFTWTGKLTSPDYTPCSIKLTPYGKITEFPVTQNATAADSRIITLKPLAGGAWVVYNDVFANSV
jgi:hypothetical protein